MSVDPAIEIRADTDVRAADLPRREVDRPAFRWFPAPSPAALHVEQ